MRAFVLFHTALPPALQIGSKRPSHNPCYTCAPAHFRRQIFGKGLFSQNYLGGTDKIP